MKTQYKTNKVGPENEIPDTSGLVEKTDYNTIIIEIEVNIPNTTGLATTAAFDAVGNKIPNVNNLVKEEHFMIQKHLTLSKNILVLLIIINLQIK